MGEPRNIIERGRAGVQGLRVHAERTAWEGRRCPYWGDTLTCKWGGSTRRPWTFAGPPRVPTDLEDLDARLELRRRLAPLQLDLFAPTEPRGSGDVVPATAASA